MFHANIIKKSSTAIPPPQFRGRESDCMESGLREALERFGKGVA